MSDAKVAFDARVFRAVLVSTLLHAGLLLAASRWDGAPGQGEIHDVPASGGLRIVVGSTAAPSMADQTENALDGSGARIDRTGASIEPRTVWIDTSRYYGVTEITTPPRPLRSLAPSVTLDAADEGRVVVSVGIGESGRVENVIVLSSVPPGVFDVPVKSSLLNTPFRPGVLAGVPVRSRLTLEFNFSRGSSEVAEARNLRLETP